MTENLHGPDLRDHLAEVVKGYDDLVNKNGLLAIECECTLRQNTILADDNERLQSELERVIGSNKKLLRENARLIRVLTGAGNLISDGVQEIQAARYGERAPLRGVPMRDGDPMPNVVRMGPI